MNARVPPANSGTLGALYRSCATGLVCCGCPEAFPNMYSETRTELNAGEDPGSACATRTSMDCRRATGFCAGLKLGGAASMYWALNTLSIDPAIRSPASGRISVYCAGEEHDAVGQASAPVVLV